MQLLFMGTKTITSKRPLTDFAGILSGKSAVNLEKSVANARREMDARAKRAEKDLKVEKY